MVMKNLIILFYFFNLTGKSQEEAIIQYMNLGIENIIKFTEIKESNKSLMTYSIQLYSNETPTVVKKVKNQYQLLFPDEIIDEVFEPPYFKIITGHYLDKQEAEKRLKLIQKKFKSSFILKRAITIEQLLNNKRWDNLEDDN